MLINQNTSSAIIRSWQSFLNQQGFEVGTPDGIWGSNTAAASKAFQTQNNLVADGIVGTNTINAAKAKGFEIPAATAFEPTGNLNAVFDISHLNPNVNFSKAKLAGMQAVFHKGTQSGGNTLFKDPTYHNRQKAALEAGLLWGAYHFGTGGDGAVQANEFLDYIQPNDDTLLVLDFERATTHGETTMSMAEGSAFVQQIKDKTGKYPGIYGGSTLKAVMQTTPNSVFTKCWLWIAQYGTVPHLPNGWTDYTFWQFSDGTVGPGPLPIDGVGHCDRDLFHGTSVELNDFWRANQV